MNITYLWTATSGYLAACIRALGQRPGVNATLFTFQHDEHAPFDAPTTAAARHIVLDDASRGDYGVIKRLVMETNPHVIVIAGWAHKPYVRLCFDRDFSTVRFVIGADTPIRFDFRQRIGRLKIGRLLRKADALCVPGERGFQLMRYWGVPGDKVTKMLYGVDYDLFCTGGQKRLSQMAIWPKRFTFAGRLVPSKGPDILAEAYDRYRDAVSDPWPLTICGAGPMEHMFHGRPGIRVGGFLQPDQLSEEFQETGVFVLPSRSEPWGQVIVEAAASGLPIICTQACGASAELIRDYHNGLVIPAGDPRALTAALRWMHDHHDRLQAMGSASREFAAPFSAQRWAENQHELAIKLCASPAERRSWLM